MVVVRSPFRHGDDVPSRKPLPSPAGHTSGQVTSSVGAETALSLIDAIPFCAAAFEVHPWLAAMISPLAAFR